MRIRRQAPPSLAVTQGDRAENSSNASMSSSVVADLQTASSPQQVSEDVHISFRNLSMIYSASKFRASVNWLDRLRAAKGFPVDHTIGVDQALSSRACSSDEIECGCCKEGASFCLRQESQIEMDAIGLLHNNTSKKQCEVSSCRTLVSDSKDLKVAPRSFPRRNGSAEVESLHSHPFGEHSSLALRMQDVFHESGDAPLDMSCCQSLHKLPASSSIATLHNSVRKNASRADKCSRSTVIQNSSCDDSHIHSTLSQLYHDVFADLFCMGSYNTGSNLWADAKRRQRKQEKPKVCSTFADLDPPCTKVPSPQLQTCEFDTFPVYAIDLASPTSQSEVDAAIKVMPSSSPEVQGVEPTLNLPKRASNKLSTAQLKRKSGIELKGLRKSDLFIIDSSIPGWRTEKVIFRKGNSWRIRSKEVIPSATSAAADCIIKDEIKPDSTPHCSSNKLDVSKLPDNCEFDICAAKDHDVHIDQTQILNNDPVGRIWNIAPHTHVRSSRKRRRITLVAEEPSNANSEAVVSDDISLKKAVGFEPDHPANQSQEGLVFSIYQVFMQAGKSGLTPREAVSRILEQGLPGLHEGGVVPRVEVLKIVSNSPYFMPLEESKYILCSALVGDEDGKLRSKLHLRKDVPSVEPKVDENEFDCIDNAKSARPQGISQYWAACAAIRRARTGTTRRKSSLRSQFLNPLTHEADEEIAYLANRKRLKSVKQDVAGLGNPCNRSDGKGWHCPLRAKVGYLLCDHHLDRLRTRVKSHIKSKVLSITSRTKEERKRILTGSWVVKKVVERSRSGRPSMVVNTNDSFHSMTPEFSVSKVSQM